MEKQNCNHFSPFLFSLSSVVRLIDWLAFDDGFYFSSEIAVERIIQSQGEGLEGRQGSSLGGWILRRIDTFLELLDPYTTPDLSS